MQQHAIHSLLDVMALVQSMDVAIEHQVSSSSNSGGGALPAAVVPAEPMMPASAWYEQTQQEDQPRDHSVIQRVDTPCPAALRQQQHQQAESSSNNSSIGGSFVLLPDRAEPGTSSRFIPLEAGQTTVVSEEEVGRGGEGWRLCWRCRPRYEELAARAVVVPSVSVSGVWRVSFCTCTRLPLATFRRSCSNPLARITHALAMTPGHELLAPVPYTRHMPLFCEASCVRPARAAVPRPLHKYPHGRRLFGWKVETGKKIEKTKKLSLGSAGSLSLSVSRSLDFRQPYWRWCTSGPRTNTPDCCSRQCTRTFGCRYLLSSRHWLCGRPESTLGRPTSEISRLHLSSLRQRKSLTTAV